MVFSETEPWPWNQQGTNSEVPTMFSVPDIYTADEDEQIDSNIFDGNNSISSTPEPQSPTSTRNPDNYDDSTEPKKTRRLSEIYNETSMVDLDEELYLVGFEEPANYRQAIQDNNWKQAMRREINSIEENNTWKLTTLPPGQKVIGLKWIFKLKKDASGKIIKHKARLVAKGYA